MSKKKYRTPPGGAQQGHRQAENETSTHASRTPREVFDRARTNASPEDLQEYIQSGWALFQDLYTGWVSEGGSGPLSDDEARSALGTCVRFLHQVVNLTRAMLNTVDPAELRNIIAPDMKLPEGVRMCLQAAGVDVSELESRLEDDTPQPEDARKRPRGRKHPLLVLITLSVQASRLIDRITAKTNPHVHNLPNLAEKHEDATTRMMMRG